MKCLNSFLGDTVSAFVYLTSRYGIFNVEVETKVDHVENAMPSKGGGQALIKSTEAKAVCVYNTSGLFKCRGLLHGETQRAKTLALSK